MLPLTVFEHRQTCMTHPTDTDIRDLALEIAGCRPAGRTACPSEVARGLARIDGPTEAWRCLMPAVHRVLEALEQEGAIVRTQGGRPVLKVSIRGAYRFMRRPDNGVPGG
ncbi:MAG: DUF3253 domain-containing protein [Hyphomicrobium sp.]|nr:DUF3253 domain-containing protein [Hyphomicrobium sp.]